MVADTQSHTSSEPLEVLTFHHVPGCDTEIGVLAQLFTLTQPMHAHCHDFLEIAFAVSGSGHHEDEQGRLPLLSGDVWVIQAGQWHAYPRVEGSVSIFNLLLTHDFLIAHAAALQGTHCLSNLPMWAGDDIQPSPTPPVHYLRLSPQGLNCIRALLVTLANELQASRAAGHACLSVGLVLQILGLLDRYGTSEPTHSARALVAHGDQGLLAAVRHIEEHSAEPLTLEEIARESGYTPTYLARKFRQHLGVPPIDYLLQVRLHHACALLKTTDRSVTSIAHEVGFSDSRYFATRFRQALGMTPTQFRTCNELSSIVDTS